MKFKPTTGNRILSDVAFIVLDHGGVREAGREGGVAVEIRLGGLQNIRICCDEGAARHGVSQYWVFCAPCLVPQDDGGQRHSRQGRRWTAIAAR